MTQTDGRTRIVIYYAVWATICAALSGFVFTLIHTWFFSFIPTRSAALKTLFDGAMITLAIAAAQGAVALLTGSILAHYGRPLRSTVLLGLIIGAFDFAMYFVQMVVPSTELGWGPDLVILAVVAAAVTALGGRGGSVTASGA